MNLFLIPFLIVFIYGVSSSGFYGCGTGGGSDATDMIMDRRDGGGRNGGEKN